MTIEEIEKDELLESEIINYSCPSCGDEMLFHPKDETLKCVSCGNAIIFANNITDIEENCFLEELEKENSIDINNSSTDNEVECKNCGATTIYKDNIISNKCVYCGSSNVLKHENATYIKPKYLLPFKITKKDCSEYVFKWCQRKFFMNRNFKAGINASDLYGVYIPYWTYDTTTLTHYTALRGVHYYVTMTRTVNGKQETYQQLRTRWRPVSGTYNHFFDDVLVPATTNDNIDYKKIIAFNLEDLVTYDEKYILGFLAKKYDLTLKNGWLDAKVVISNELEFKIKDTIGGDVVRNLKLNTNYNDITYKHILLPVWIYTYNYKDTVYNFLVNGQSGRVYGNYPKDWIRITLVAILSLFCFLILYYALGFVIG